MRYAKIIDGVVVNVEEFGEGFTPDGVVYVAAPVTGSPGDTYDPATGVFMPGSIPPLPVPETISDRQFFQQATIAGWITQDEALAAVQSGAIPQKLLTFINSLPVEEQFSAKMRIGGSVEYHRSDELVPAFGAEMTPPLSSADIDDFWRSASQL